MNMWFYNQEKNENIKLDYIGLQIISKKSNAKKIVSSSPILIGESTAGTTEPRVEPNAWVIWDWAEERKMLTHTNTL